MPGRIPLAWLQLKRERLRFAVGVAGVAFAAILIFMQLGFREALFASAVRFHGHLRADIVLLNPQSEFLARMEPFARRRLQQALGVPGVASVAHVILETGIWRNPETRGSRVILVVGFDPTDEVLALPEVEARVDALRYPDVALFDEASRPEYGPIAAAVRDGHRVDVEVHNRRITVVGLFPLGTSFGIDGTIITSDLNFQRLFPRHEPGLIDLGLVRLAPGADVEAVRRAIEAALPDDVEVLTRAAYMEREKAYWATGTPIGYIFTFGAIMGLVVGAIIVYQILFADISSHLAEYATLKAMGYTNRYLVTVVLQEAAILGVVGYLPGLLVASQLYGLTERATRLPMDLHAGIGGLVLGLTLGMCAVSATIALRKVRSADPAEVF